ncbi:hypothetical protein [Brevundimonas sp. NPDC058933]|uniref:hypothetical protein n=1 Tax=Brevundimonas sp. NPDC058933 TaxID=3346673 RepID=UPI003BEEBE81
MNERRIFLIIRTAEDGLTVTVTPVQPAEQPDAVAVIRTVGDVAVETTLHFPGAVIRQD